MREGRQGRTLFALIVASLMFSGPVTHALAQPTPPAENLARKFWEGQGGLTGRLESTFAKFLTPQRDQPAGAHLTAFQEAINRNRAAIQEADNKVVDLISEAYTNQELASYLAFFGTTVGRSIQQKREASARSLFPGPYHAPDFTQEERNAFAEYAGSPEAKGIAAKGAKLFGPELAIMTPVEEKVFADYCQAVGDCPGKQASH